MKTDRKIRVSTCTFMIHNDLSETHPMTYEENMEQAVKYLNQAGKVGSDIMVLPEFFNCKGLWQWFQPNKDELAHKEIAEKIPSGRTIKTVAKYAKKYGMYVAADILENDNGKFYNTVALIDRKGKLCGKYRKSHLPPGEETYVLPGNSLPVFKTDFGTVGILVCFDLNFPEAAMTLALKGAELILWPTMWPSLIPTSFYMDTFMKGTAMMNGVHFVSSGYSKPDPDSDAPGHSAVVSPTGLVLADTGFNPGFATAEVWLNRSSLSYCGCSMASNKHEFHLKEWSERRRPELYKEITIKKKVHNVKTRKGL